MAFFLALAGALPSYIQSSHLEKFIGLSAVTWFFVAANLISVLAIIVFPKVIKSLGNYLTTKIIALLFLVSLTGLGLSTNYYFIFLFFVLMHLALNLIWINMDIFVESFSKTSSTGQTRTIYFTIINLAWIMSPNLSASLINLNNYSMVFLVAALLIIPFLVIFLFYAKKIKDHLNYKKSSITKTLKQMYLNKNLRGILWLAMLLNVFFNATMIFVPIYLNKTIGFSWTEIGLMFSIMLIPFILIEIPAGILADKYFGEKEMLYIGYAILVVCLFLFFISESKSFWFWTILLFSSRIGAALVEAMRETYFFKKVAANDLDKINIFRTAIPFGYLLGSLISLVVLVFLPISYIFLITAAILCSAFPFIMMIKDTK
jgi:MFS family permease